MYLYHFYGTVYPERVNFDIRGLPTIGFLLPDLNIEGQLEIFSERSQLTITFKTDQNLLNHPQNDILITLKNAVGSQARLYVDAYCYLRSFNYDLEIYRVKCEELGIDITFDVQLETDLDYPGDSVTRQERINAGLGEIISLCLNNPKLLFLEHVFADFRRGIKYPESTGFFFYRALDSIRKNAFEGNWERMNNSLGLTQNHYADLNHYRKENAHGLYPPISGAERLKLAKDTRKVIDAFIAFAYNL